MLSFLPSDTMHDRSRSVNGHLLPHLEASTAKATLTGWHEFVRIRTNALWVGNAQRDVKMSVLMRRSFTTAGAPAVVPTTARA